MPCLAWDPVALFQGNNRSKAICLLLQGALAGPPAPLQARPSVCRNPLGATPGHRSEGNPPAACCWDDLSPPTWAIHSEAKANLRNNHCRFLFSLTNYCTNVAFLAGKSQSHFFSPLSQTRFTFMPSQNLLHRVCYGDMQHPRDTFHCGMTQRQWKERRKAPVLQEGEL